MQSGLDLTAVRIAPRTPRNIAPVLDAGLAQVLKRLMHETFASAALKFLPGRWKDLSDEIAAAFAFYFTSLSLWRDGGSIGESLYGVVREDLVLKKDKLTAWNQVAFTALVHVCGPYVDNKLGKVRESVVLRSLDDEGSQEPLSETFLAGRWTDVATGAFWRKVFLSVYPAVKFGLGARDVWQRIMFISGMSKWPTLEHYLIEMPVRRQTFREWDMQNKLRAALRQKSIQDVLSRSKPTFKRWLVLNLLKGKYFLQDYNKAILTVFALSCTGLQWWFTTGKEAAKLPGKALPPPPPPVPHPEGKKLPKSPRLCPICRRTKTNPTVLTVTGYVFCYNCIMLYVKENKNCPVTHIPAHEQHVRRLYLST